MSLYELVYEHADVKAQNSVPEWMVGHFSRRSISFANGETDTSTRVIWMQSRNFTLDLRLPIPEEMPRNKQTNAYCEDDLRALANLEGWFARSAWQNNMLSWHESISLQLHDRWPEPALLQRVGNSMVEFAPSGAYVEDWRLANRSPGPLVGLRLEYEKNLRTNAVTHRGGGLIVCGEFAGIVLGRETLPEEVDGSLSLRDQSLRLRNDENALQKLFNFECSVGYGSLDKGFKIFSSTNSDKDGQSLLNDSHFERMDNGSIRQTLAIDGDEHERIYTIDSIEKMFEFSMSTPASEQANAWFDGESETLRRYTGPIF